MRVAARIAAAVVCVVCGWAGPAAAGALEALIAATAAPYVAEVKPGGLVIGAVRGNDTAVLGFGRTGGPDARPPDGRTVFQIASLTKPFTGTILAELIRTGRVAPGDPLDRHLSPAERPPRHGGRPIRLLDLATHTAGLPNVPETAGFSWNRVQDRRNPYKPLTRAEVDQWLAGFDPAEAPGTRFRYSNIGMALLGEALEAATGQTYDALLSRAVTRRLGLSDTTLTLTAGQRARKAIGHAGGHSVPDWEAPAMQPAFGLYSTADDLLIWLRANLGDCGGACPDDVARTLALAQRVQVDGRSLTDSGQLGDGAMALGWIVAWAKDGTPVHWHSGSTGGFNAYMAFSRARRWGVVVLTNSDPDRIVADRLAIDLIRRIEGR